MPFAGLICCSADRAYEQLWSCAVMKKCMVFTVILFFVLPCLFAFDSFKSMKDYFSESEMNKLENGEYLEARTNRGEDVYHLAIPGSEGYDLTVKASKEEKSFTVGVSQFIPYPDSIKNASDSEKVLNVYNRMLKISTLKGIEYVSFRAGDKLKTLFSDACMIDSPKKNKAVPDAQVSKVDLFTTYYARLTDTKFGSNKYIADYIGLKDEICVEITNYDVIKYLGLKVVDKEGLHMFVDVKFFDEGVLVYAFAVVYNSEPDVQVLFIEVSLDGAFITRIKALKDWFIVNMAD